MLGAGRVGGLIAQDLAVDPGLEVSLADRSATALATIASTGTAGAITTVEADLAAPGAVATLAAQADVVVGAVPGRFGLAMLKEVIQSRTPVVDISFSPESPLVLHDQAKAAGVPVVVDCGVAPGLSNLLAGRAVAELDRTDSISIMVGGLPVRRFQPFEYRSVFSPTDVVEEYTRPCRMRIGGREVTVDALTGIEQIDFPGIGTLEAFNTDGLRTLLDAPEMSAVPDMKEKTLRYPGHAEKMRMLRETGFFNDTPVQVEGVQISPRALTEALLFKAWEPAAGEEEFTVLRVEAEGQLAGQPRRIAWDLLDTTDHESGATSMARTTGFPCAIVARMLAAGEWSQAGVAPPEKLGADAGITAGILEQLSRRGVQVRREG